MTMLIFLSFLAFFLYLQLGLFVLFSNVGSKVNRAFFYLCSSLVVWSFGTIFINLSPALSVVRFWDRFASFGWIFFPSFLVMFFIKLKKSDRLFLPNLFLLVFFTSASLFFLQALLGNLLVKDYYQFNRGWYFHTNMDSVWYWLFLFYLAFALIYSLYSLIGWSLEAVTIKEKRQSRIIIVTLILFFSGIFVCNYLIPLLGDVSTPGLIHLLSIIWVTGFGYAIVKYKFMVLSPALAANEIISKMNELLFFVDNDGNVIRINRFTEETLGFGFEEVVQKPFISLLADNNTAESNMAELNSQDIARFRDQKSYLKRKSGDTIPFHLSSAVVKDEAGDILGTIIVGYDVRYQKLLEEEIELRKKAEQSLIESENRARQLYLMVRLMCDNAPDMIWAKDLNRQYLFVNKATSEKLLNASDTDEPIGKSDQYFFTREKKSQPNNKSWFTFGDYSIDSDAVTLHNRQSGRFVEVGNIKNRFVYLDVHKAPFLDESGNLIGIVGCGRDITAEKQADEEKRAFEKALEREKEFLAVTLKSIGEGVIGTDKEGRIVLMNSIAEDLTGINKTDVWGKPLGKVIKLRNRETKEKIELPIKESLETRKIISLSSSKNNSDPLALLDKQARQYLVYACIAPILNGDNEAVGSVLIFSDVTDKTRLENELIKIQRMESMSVLAGGIAHDFNNILAAIIGNLSITMFNLRDNLELMPRLQDVEKACFRAKDLTLQLLTLSKKSIPIKKIIRLEKMIKDTALFAIRGSNCDCHFDISPELNSVEVDEGQISQVINNLVINAKQSMPKGGSIRVTSHNVTVDDADMLPLSAGQYVKLTLADKGTGISAMDLQKIFDPFYTTKKKGSGLGLTSSFSIVKKHNGYMTVESQLGVGSCFTIYLPALDEKTEDFEVTESVYDFQDSGNVLIMDDEEDILKPLSEMLQKIGYEVVPVAKAEQAIERFEAIYEQKKHFDFVILDLTIKGGQGGIEVLQHFRKADPYIKAILSSGYSSDGDSISARYREYGFNEVMSKPYTFDILVNTIRRLKQISKSGN